LKEPCEAAMLDVGDEAPDFSLPDQDGRTVTLESLLAAGDLVLYFYPADFTPVCTREACAFRDRHEPLRQIGVNLVGVSPQSAGSHRRFRQAHDLPFALLCDEDKQVIRAFGVDGPLGFGVRRATFHVGSDRWIKGRALADVFLSSHVELIERVLGRVSRAPDRA
jgi:peroxiredoxin Q/BCP